MVEAASTATVVVREYDSARDRGGVEAVERACEVGSSGGGKMCLFTDLLGDPLCRIRHSPAFLMLLAQPDAGGEPLLGSLDLAS
ncbi:putative N-acetyltransferase HLS1-like [Panicum miliaceum]|uniref:N-acetyltransferase HLS1-like n=1 Tax=Panicum miliaceum TaxID=4540 RepID=A0A3L6S719_PANMI|nr:putative N-acetyltransferase HLS1-like [Panicum miliaceum]